MSRGSAQHHLARKPWGPVSMKEQGFEGLPNVLSLVVDRHVPLAAIL